MYEIDLELYTISIIQMNSALEKLAEDEFDAEYNGLLRQSIDNFAEIYRSSLIDLSLTEIDYGEYDHFFIYIKSTFPGYASKINEYRLPVKNEELKSNLENLVKIMEDFLKIADIYFKKRGFTRQ